MLIKKEPIGHVKIDKEGHIVEIEHYSDGKKKSCIYCGKLTKKRILGTPECKECIEYGYQKCSKCEYGFRASTFHCNGNDLEDHFTYYTACAMRDYHGKLRDKPNFEQKASAWPVSPIERKKCFKEKPIHPKIWCTKCDVVLENKGVALDCPDDGIFYECPKCNCRIVIFKKGE